MSFHLEQQHPAKPAGNIERDRPDKSNAALVSAASIMVMAALLITACSIYLTLILQWQGPFRDLWEFVGNIERQFNGEWSLDYLLEAYGGAHRIFLPKLLFFADYYWLGGRNILTISTALVCQFAYLFLIIRILQQQRSLHTVERIILAAGFALALFSVTQVNNFLYAMDVQWYMSNLFGLGSLYALTQEWNQKWIAAFLLGTAAALCNFTGLMTLPIAILVILARHEKNIVQWIILLLGGLACVLYVSHAGNHQQFVFAILKNSDSWQTTAYIITDTLAKIFPYMLRYLTSPLTREWPAVGSLLSAVGIATTLYYWFLYLVSRKSLSSWQRLCLYLSSYIIASAFFTAFGRLIYPNSATAERYQTLVLPWLPSLFGLIWIDLRNLRYKNIVVVSWLLIWGCSLLPSQLTSARDMVILSQQVNLAHTAARAGVLEPPFITATLSYPLIKNGINSVKDNDSFLRSHGLGYFQKLPNFRLDKKIDAIAGIPVCTGYANMQNNEATHSWIVDGQLWAEQKPVGDIILLQNSKVIGIGTWAGFDNSLLPSILQPADSSRFRAFIREDRMQANEPLIALGVLDNKIQCSYLLTD